MSEIDEIEERMEEYLNRPDVCDWCGNEDVIGGERDDGTYVIECGRPSCPHAWTIVDGEKVDV